MSQIIKMTKVPGGDIQMCYVGQGGGVVYVPTVFDIYLSYTLNMAQGAIVDMNSDSTESVPKV